MANSVYNSGWDEKNWDAVLEKIVQPDLLELGTYYTHMIRSDIKHLAFTLSRYKFVSKLLMYKKNVRLLELGCQEALGALMFQQNLKLDKYVGIDLDENSMKWNKKFLSSDFEFICANFFELADEDICDGNFDVVVSLDVIEHISRDMEDNFCDVITSKLNDYGTCIIGTPSFLMNPYACEGSRIGHINLYDQERLFELMNKYFHNVFIFNMNDEVVNMGFAPMSCYIFAVCCNKK